MASSRFVLKGIEDMLKEEVKFFSMVRQNGERMYICLGKRALFLIDFEPPFQEMFYYAWIDKVIIDNENLLLFQVDFTEGRVPLLLESFERSKLCDEVSPRAHAYLSLTRNVTVGGRGRRIGRASEHRRPRLRS